jgi:hypothetical protein
MLASDRNEQTIPMIDRGSFLRYYQLFPIYRLSISFKMNVTPGKVIFEIDFACLRNQLRSTRSDTIEDLLAEYPSLEPEDILTCLGYAASLAEGRVTPT